MFHKRILHNFRKMGVIKRMFILDVQIYKQNFAIITNPQLTYGSVNVYGMDPSVLLLIWNLN